MSERPLSPRIRFEPPFVIIKKNINSYTEMYKNIKICTKQFKTILPENRRWGMEPLAIYWTFVRGIHLYVLLTVIHGAPVEDEERNLDVVAEKLARLLQGKIC